MVFRVYGESTTESSEAEALAATSAVTYFPYPQDKIETHRDAFYSPKYHCLFDADGIRIDSSLLRRSRNGREIWPTNIPEKIDVPTDMPCHEAPILFLGVLFPHYGHFLTECMSRYWALDRIGDPEIDLLLSPENWEKIQASGYFGDFLALAGIDDARIKRFGKAIRLREVIVPHSSFSLYYQAYSNHADLLRRVAASVVERRRPAALGMQPIYLSRSQFKSNTRRLLGEPLLEDALRRQGFRIIYPENITFVQQLVFYNTNKIFVSPRGSALHNFVFSNVGSQQYVYVPFESGGNPVLGAQYLVDCLANLDSHYIGALRRITNELLFTEPNSSRVDYEVDVGMVMEWLHNQGVFSLSPRPAKSTPAPASVPDRHTDERKLSAGKLVAHIARRGDVANSQGLFAGARFSGAAIEGFVLEPSAIPADEIQYAVRTAKAGWSGWVPGGTFCGNRLAHDPVLSFAVRLRGNTADQYDCTYWASFVDVPDPSFASDGGACGAADGAPLEALQIRLRPKLKSNSDGSIEGGTFLAHIAFEGDVRSNGLAVGRAGSGRRIEGFQADMTEIPNPLVEYRAKLSAEHWSEWTPGGQFVGTRGHGVALRGVAFRLLGQAALEFQCDTIATFIDAAEPVRGTNGEACEGEAGAKLESIQCVIRPRARERLGVP